jgi:DNA-directed RNA polymerase specialized sigma24 family protein
MKEDEDPFERFLLWLSPDREAAEKKLKDIRRRLIVLLDLRGCTLSEDLADEALLRFVRRLPAMVNSFKTDDPIPYLYTTAYHLHLEYIQKQFMPLPDDVSELPQPNAADDLEEERLHECLDKCLDGMDQEGREMVLAYYRWEKQTKIEFRKALARQLGISTNALRIKIYHLRNALQACIEECLELKPRAEMK